MKKTVIEFIGSASPYHAGDIAGFDEAAAKAYIDAKVAKLHKAGGAAPVGNGSNKHKANASNAPTESLAPTEAGDDPAQAPV